jgi:hypothetical protein
MRSVRIHREVSESCPPKALGRRQALPLRGVVSDPADAPACIEAVENPHAITRERIASFPVARQRFALIRENKDLTGPLILLQRPAHQQRAPFKTSAQVGWLGRQTYPQSTPKDHDCPPVGLI